MPEVGTNRKPDDDMSETNSDEDDASSSAGEKEKEEVSAAEAQVAEGSTTTTTAQADDNNAENEASQSSTDTSNSDGIPSDQVIRSGSVQWIEWVSFYFISHVFIMNTVTIYHLHDFNDDDLILITLRFASLEIDPKKTAV